MIPPRPLTRWLFPCLAILILAGGAMTGCGSQPDPAAAGLALAPLHTLPHEVQQAPLAVRQAYQFAALNPDVMQRIPCYCGCGPMGHKSSYDCYVSGPDAAGNVTYDSHALGCSICVDITQDVMRLLRQGESTPAIRNYIDATYTRYGPSNMP